MARRGRTSAAEMALASVVAPVVSNNRLQPPIILSDAERTIWIDLVNDQPANAFSATHVPLLEQYCLHVVQARIISDEIMNFEQKWLSTEDGLKRYDRLLAMQEREGRAISSIATRLRITRQAVIDPKTAGRAGRGGKEKRPWEIEM